MHRQKICRFNNFFSEELNYNLTYISESCHTQGLIHKKIKKKKEKKEEEGIIFFEKKI